MSLLSWFSIPSRVSKLYRVTKPRSSLPRNVAPVRGKSEKKLKFFKVGRSQGFFLKVKANLWYCPKSLTTLVIIFSLHTNCREKRKEFENEDRNIHGVQKSRSECKRGLFFIASHWMKVRGKLFRAQWKFRESQCRNVLVSDERQLWGRLLSTQLLKVSVR